MAEGKTLSLMKPKKGTGFSTNSESSYQHWMNLPLDCNEKGRGRRMGKRRGRGQREKEIERERDGEKG